MKGAMHKRICAWMALLAACPCADAACKLTRYAELPVTMDRGRALVSATVNGVDAKFFADSGAFFSMVSADAARRFHLTIGPLPPWLKITGASGSAEAQLGMAHEFKLEGFGTVHGAEFLVGGNAFAGGSAGILGQNLLGFRDAEFDLANGIIRLMRADGCHDAMLAYWQKDGDVAVVPIREVSPAYPHLIGKVNLNGSQIGVLFDSGAAQSVLDKRAARRAGIKLDGPDVTPGGVSEGLNGHALETWITRFDSLDLGGEIIRNARLRIADVELPDGADMLLGMDFFLSHHLYVANSERRIFITYNGGHVFDLRPNAPAVPEAAAGAAAGAAAAPDAAAAPAEPAAPVNAEALRRRAAALAERGDLSHALVDLNAAVDAEPGEAANFHQRGKVLARLSELNRAAADYDQALQLRPDDRECLLDRGALRLQRRDEPGARADFDRILALAPNDMDEVLRVAEAYERSGYYRDAVLRLDQWVASNRSDDRLPAVLGARCRAHALLGDALDQAVDDCNSALRHGQRTANIYDARALAYLRRNELDRAIADFSDALRLQPRDPAALYGRGVAESYRGSKDVGQKDMEAGTASDAGIQAFYERIGLKPDRAGP
jgi:tetratricopeptide (TPR) repeat protein/predicted aspartyl protease